MPDDRQAPLSSVHRYVNERLAEDIKEFDHVIFQSEFSKRKADEHLYCRRDRFSIIHNGVDTDYFQPSERRASSEPIIVVLGKHYPDHLRLAAEVFRKLQASQPCKLLVIGPMRDGSHNVREVIGAFLAGDPSLDKVECAGTIPFEGLPARLSTADLFLHLKVGDSCPNAVAEALSCGLPVICPQVGGTREIVGDGGLAVSGSPADGSLAESMVAACRQVFGNLAAFQTAARERAVTEFDRRAVAARYLEVLGLCEARVA